MSDSDDQLFGKIPGAKIWQEKKVLRGSDFLPGLLKSGIMMNNVHPFETILDLSRPHCTLENVLVICRAVSDALQEFGWIRMIHHHEIYGDLRRVPLPVSYFSS